jgi:polyisoprenoid-binding protein YceI
MVDQLTLADKRRRVRRVAQTRPIALLIVLGLTIRVSAATAQTTRNTYYITNARVAVMCALTAGASFKAQSTAVVGSLALANGSHALSGVVEVDLATLETGIALRDRHMRDIYLEIRRGDNFATARLEEIYIDHSEGSTPFHGMLILHGQQHAISGVVDLQGQHDGGVSVRARFPISLAAFGIPPPRYLGVGVQDEVQVQVTFTAVPRSYD